MKDFDNIKCTDLRQYNYEKLDDISRNLKLNHDELSQNKRNGVSKLWIDTLNFFNVIAYTVGKDPQIIIADNFLYDLATIGITNFTVKNKDINVVNIIELVAESKIKLEELNNLLAIAIQDEDYLKAAVLRTKITEISKHE